MCKPIKPNGCIDDVMHLAPGQHIATQRRGYVHHGIYVGNGRVIHYPGLSWSFRRAPVSETSIDEFTGGRVIWAETTFETSYTGEEVVRRAYLRVGEDRYRVVSNNCEHFCTWCMYGKSRSYQIERLRGIPSRWLGILVSFSCRITFSTTLLKDKRHTDLTLSELARS
jgi:hypothetical protein